MLALYGADRGQFSCEVILHLFALKLRHPDKVYLIRGNHECSSVRLLPPLASNAYFYRNTRLRCRDDARAYGGCLWFCCRRFVVGVLVVDCGAAFVLFGCVLRLYYYCGLIDGMVCLCFVLLGLGVGALTWCLISRLRWTSNELVDLCCFGR